MKHERILFIERILWSSVFLLAYDGTPEIKTEFERIIAEHYPDAGLDADAARRVQDLFMRRLKYDVDGLLLEEMWKEARWTVRGVKAVIGVVSERDGTKWITASQSNYAVSEIEYISSEAGDTRFRSTVEAEPAATTSPGQPSQPSAISPTNPPHTPCGTARRPLNPSRNERVGNAVLPFEGSVP